MNVERDRTVARRERRATPAPDDRTAPEAVGQARPARVVLKIGGRSLAAPGAHDELAAEVQSFSGETLLVHGGGAEVSEWCVRLGVEPRFVDGLRVTDETTLEVAVAILGGLANARLVARLRAGGVDAIGLNALDGGVVEVEPHPDAARLGRVGRVKHVNAAWLETLLAAGRTPVLASLGAHQGELLNLNADEIAGALAAAVEADALILLSDTPGVRLGGAIVRELDPASLAGAIASADVTGGMLPKLEAAGVALAGGVSRVAIGSWSGPRSLEALLAGAGCTTLTAHPRPESSHV